MTAAKAVPGQKLTIAFDPDSAKMPESVRSDLNRMVAAFNEQADLRLRIFAYAGGPTLSTSQARRLSLSRALDVRDYLMKQGVRSTRIDVRALGNKEAEEQTAKDPINRVDVTIVDK